MDHNNNTPQSRKRKDETRDHDQQQYDEDEYPQNVESSSAKYKKRNSKENLIEDSDTAKNQESTDTTIENSKDNPKSATDMIDKQNPDSEKEQEEDKINDEKADEENKDMKQETDSKHSKSRQESENKSEEEKMEDIDEEKEVKLSVRDGETNSELQPITLPRELPVSLTKIWGGLTYYLRILSVFTLSFFLLKKVTIPSYPEPSARKWPLHKMVQHNLLRTRTRHFHLSRRKPAHHYRLLHQP